MVKSVLCITVCNSQTTQITQIGTGKICSQTGNKLGKHREFENAV